MLLTYILIYLSLGGCRNVREIGQRFILIWSITPFTVLKKWRSLQPIRGSKKLNLWIIGDQLFEQFMSPVWPLLTLIAFQNYLIQTFCLLEKGVQDAFIARLEKRIEDHDADIEKMCNHHYQVSKILFLIKNF